MSRSATPTPETNRAILHEWDKVFAQRGDDVAVFAADGSALRTFAAIERECSEFLDRFRGIPHRAVVGVQIGNSPSWPAVFLALLRGGFITLPLSADAVLPAFVHAVIGGDLNVRTMRAGEPDGALENTALLKLTSGTTGTPRAIRFTAAQLAADCVNICQTMGITAGDLNYGVIPFAHSYGFSNLITPLVMHGVSLVVSEDRFPRAILEGLRRTRATVFPGTPQLFHHLAAVADGHLEHARLGISAGAPLSRAIWSEVRDRTGLELHTFYGASECGGIAYDRTGSLPEDGFVGEAMENVRLEIEPDGRLTVHSDAAGAGYFPGPDPEMLGAGRYRSSDLARPTIRGFVLVGRVSDFINIGGRKLNPIELEQRLAGFAGVRHIVVFGVESRLRGEEPVACVVGEVDRAALLRYAATLVPSWQVPKDVWVVPELPVSERGKISRRALAERYMQERSKLQTE